LELPEGDLVVLVGSNNSGKSAILQYINTHSELRDKADYVSPRRFDLSNEVAIALNQDQELQNAWNQRKDTNPAIAELTAPDPIRELVSLPNDARAKIVEWHNRYFGELAVQRSRADNDYAAPRVTIDGRLATQQGSGSRAVLSVLCSLLHPARPVVLIDEPEIGIEPQVQKRLAELIRRVASGADGLQRKTVYVATHSHLFLDKTNLNNNWIVSKDAAGHARLRQMTAPEDLHATIYRLLGNSPDDLFFPDNILVVEGPTDQIYLRRLFALRGAGGVAVHFADGEGGVAAALPRIEQMLKTLAYVPWYRERMCVLVDGDVPAARVNEWRSYLRDDGTRVRALPLSGIEYYYPASLVCEVCNIVEGVRLPSISSYLSAIRGGARQAPLGGFTGSKRQLAQEIESRLTVAHLEEVAPEILDLIDAVSARRFSVLPPAE
jgi:ABC-type phosphonate transport system ATPase subunit